MATYFLKIANKEMYWLAAAKASTLLRRKCNQNFTIYCIVLHILY